MSPTPQARQHHYPRSPGEEALVQISLTTQSHSTSPLSSLPQECRPGSLLCPPTSRRYPRHAHCSPCFHASVAPRGMTRLDAVRCTASWTCYLRSRVKGDVCHEPSESPGSISSEVTGSTFGSGNEKWQINICIYLSVWNSFQERFLNTFFFLNPQWKFNSEEVILWFCDLQNYLLPPGASGEVCHLLYVPLPSDTHSKSICKAVGNYINSTIHEMYENMAYD